MGHRDKMTMVRIPTALADELVAAFEEWDDRAGDLATVRASPDPRFKMDQRERVQFGEARGRVVKLAWRGNSKSHATRVETILQLGLHSLDNWLGQVEAKANDERDRARAESEEMAKIDARYQAARDKARTKHRNGGA